jgi:NADH:ubiquinone oxidoreductase subunit E
VQVYGRVAHTGHEVRGQRHLLLPALEAVQARIGWISDGALGYICERLTIPPADAYGVATFYGLLSMEPRPPRVLHICEDVACRCHGSEELIAAVESEFGVEDRDEGGCTWLRSPCLGQCDRAPAAMLTVAGEQPHEEVLAPVAADEAIAALRGGLVEPAASATVPQQGEPGLRLLHRIGVVDPRSLHDYRATGGYDALRLAFKLGQQGVIREVKDSGLMGRGGAAFPCGVKWEAVAQQPVTPHYLVCNADESEPGTFKDRVVMLGELLERAGGVPGGHELQAVMLGGAAGFFVGPDDLGIPLTFEGVREAGVTLGSGVVCVFDETVDVGRMLMRIAAFFRDESCGQCTPCRVGTVRQEEALARLLSGQVRGSVAEELALLGDVGTCMRDSSICGLGQTAAGAIQSAIDRLEVFQ